MKCPNCNLETKLVNWVTEKKSIMVYQCKTCGFTAPPNSIKIEEIYAFVSVDKDNHEGVIAINTAHGPMPMIAADKARLEYLRPHAVEVARKTKMKVRLLKFSTREEIEEYE